MTMYLGNGRRVNASTRGRFGSRAAIRATLSPIAYELATIGQERPFASALWWTFERRLRTKQRTFGRCLSPASIHWFRMLSTIPHEWVRSVALCCLGH